MTPKLLLEVTIFAECIFSAVALILMARKKIQGKFAFLTAFLAIYTADTLFCGGLLFFRTRLGIAPIPAYRIYFYGYWFFTLAEHGLLLCVIYQVFREAMTPFKGLQRVGTFIFKWAVVASMLLGIAAALAPGGISKARLYAVTGQFEQGISILTICLLVFVCFAIRPLGMTYRSYLFGISLGLGLIGTANLVESASFAVASQRSVYSPIYLIGTIGGLLALSVWATYFAMPEPARKMVLLPTTSPYFHWNQISEALGDDPGMVVVSGFTPDVLAPAERLVLGAAARRKRLQGAARESVALAQAEPQPELAAAQR